MAASRGGIWRNQAAPAGFFRLGRRPARGRAKRRTQRNTCIGETLPRVPDESLTIVRDCPGPSRAPQGRTTHRSCPPATRPDVAPAAGGPLAAPGRGAFPTHPPTTPPWGLAPGQQGRVRARASGAGGRAVGTVFSSRPRRCPISAITATPSHPRPTCFAHYTLL